MEALMTWHSRPATGCVVLPQRSGETVDQKRGDAWEPFAVSFYQQDLMTKGVKVKMQSPGLQVGRAVRVMSMSNSHCMLFNSLCNERGYAVTMRSARGFEGPGVEGSSVP